MSGANRKSRPITNYSNINANFLKSSEICDIIKTCFKAGVTSITLGELQISFHARKEASKTLIDEQSHGHVTAIPSNLFDEKDLIQTDEIKLKDEYLAELKLSDPFEYESLLASDELTEE